MSLPLPAPRATRRALALVTIALLAACEDGSGPIPVGDGGIRFIAGHSRTDTIDARPVQALVVEIRDEDGRILRGEDVHFRPVLLPEGDPYYPWRYTMVLRTRGEQLTGVMNDTTDASGRAWVQYMFGSTAGAAGIEVSVPALGLVDTATFTVEPGNPAVVSAEPGDTVVAVGGSAALRGAVRDRHGNARPESVQWRVASGTATVSATGSVSAPQPGVSRVIASFAGATPDTATVGAVPAGTLAAFQPRTDGTTAIVLFATDGTGTRTRVSAAAGALASNNWLPQWSATAARLAFQLESYDGSRIHLADTTGAGRFYRLTANSVPARSEYWPQVSADGAWVYFMGQRTGGYDNEIWRVRIDGTGMEALATGRATYVSDTHPAPSPDGTRVAFASNRPGYGSFTLHVLELASGTVTPLNTIGIVPRWSPSGDRIAYLRDGQLRVVNADGSNDRAVGSNVGFPFSWSPDGQWIVGAGGYPQGLLLVEVATGAAIRVPGSAGYSSPAWVR